MHLVDTMLGPKSKYDKIIPYTYEARVSVLEWAEAYNSYYSTTICGLINYLRERNIRPEQVALYKIYQDHESPLETQCCLDGHELWLGRPRLCRALRDHYKGHVNNGHCSFIDHNRVGSGP